MKILTAFLAGVLVATAMIRPFVYFEKTRAAEPHDTVTKYALNISRQAQCKPGKFDDETMAMLREIMQIDSTRIFTEPDSNNTRIFWINRWGVADETVIVETVAGNAGGSCGATITVCAFSEVEEKWIPLLNECGYVDTVFSISHNGILDFVISDKWGMDHWAYRYDGKSIVAADFYYPLSDQELIANEYDYGKFAIEPWEVQINYMRMGTDSLPYMFVNFGLTENSLYKKDEYGNAVLVFHFEDAVEVDLLESHHNGMPDIRTLDINYYYNFYQWNGEGYVLAGKERWVCPA